VNAIIIAHSQLNLTYYDMLETPHVAVGAAIATKIPNPFIAIPLAFMSHFLLERVPHWNPHLVTEMKAYGAPTKKSVAVIAIDVALALGIGSLIAYRALPNTNHAITILAASFASVLPDLIEFPYFFLKMQNKFLLIWLKWQKALQVDAEPFWGILTQVATVAAVFLWIR
jgi:hypothetical protein